MNIQKIVIEKCECIKLGIYILKIAKLLLNFNK